MKLKQSVGDFRVRELLRPGVLQDRGPHRVYRVMKRKLTSLEAAAALAGEAGVPSGEVALVGMKDRQGITQQYMSIERGRDVRLRTPSLRIESVGFAAEELGGASAVGNAFELVVRALDPDEKRALRRNLDRVRECGYVNYFDEQRFGNLRHEQGWIARGLIEGEVEAALRRLLCAPSPFDDQRTQAFKRGLDQGWRDWDRCRDVAARFGAHRSLFEHLQEEPRDFAGAFRFVASRIRLIHLYAYQSHLWNRAVADWLRQGLAENQRVVLPGPDGRLVHPEVPLPPELDVETFRLPGPGLEDVTHPRQRACFEAVLARQGLAPERLRIDGVPGFQLKGEDRPLLVHPRHLRVRPAEPDSLNRGLDSVKLRFELPRGAYATLLVQRLLAGAHREPRPDGAFAPRGGRRDDRGPRPARRGPDDRGARRGFEERAPRGGAGRPDRAWQRDRGARAADEKGGSGRRPWGRGAERPGRGKGGGGRPWQGERGPGGSGPRGGAPWKRREADRGGARARPPRRDEDRPREKEDRE